MSPVGVENSEDEASQIRGLLPLRAERWALYHQATLLERAYRRTLSAAPPSESVLPAAMVASAASDGAAAAAAAAGNTAAIGGGGMSVNGVGTVIGPRPKGGGPVPGGPPGACIAHMPWSLPVIAQLLRCLHGLFAPETQALLGPLKV